jgi:hypothetical protein
MPNYQNQVCIEAACVAMGGSINIASTLAVVTKARLDSIAVRGDCECGDAPPPRTPTPPPVVIPRDIIVIVDGSDSYNSKAEVEGSITEGGAFGGTLKCIRDKLCPLFAGRTDINLGVIQFSGIKQLEGQYTPGSHGETGTAGLQHWRWILHPSHVDQTLDVNHDSLDGNGQLWLCLQDCALPGVLGCGGETGFAATNNKQIIVISDEEWDIRKLCGPNGGTTNREEVTALVHGAGYDVHAVIVRPNRDDDLNEDVIESLTVTKERYHKVYTDNFETEIAAAFDKIVGQLQTIYE